MSGIKAVDLVMVMRTHDAGRGYLRVTDAALEYEYQHVVVAEMALGKKLPKGVVVHHIDENRSNNSGDNLVLCPDRKYHALLHTRADALKACGHAGWRKCSYCQTYDAPKNLRIDYDEGGCRVGAIRHIECENAFRRASRARKRRPPKPPLRGELNSAAKLTTQKAAEIRGLLSIGWTQTQCASRYGVSPTLVRRVALGKSWVAE